MQQMVPVLIGVTQPPRGSGDQAAGQFYAQAIELTTSWGTQPARAQITYVSAEGFGAPVTRGALMRIEVAGHIYWGICLSDQLADNADGRTRVLEFADMRHYLGRDDVFGAFNMPEIRIVNGQRTKRYWHVLPTDYASGKRTFTTQPKTCAEVIYHLLNAPTVLSPWYNAVSPVTYHIDQVTGYVEELNFMGGSKLAGALETISNKQGLTMGLLPNAVNPYQLVWVRKGEGLLPTWIVGGQESIFPPNSGNKRVGEALSGNPNLIRVVGDRNVYQVLNVTMRPDWNRNWEAYWSVEDRWTLEVYNRLSTERAFDGIPVGTPYKDIVDDAANPGANRHIIGRQLAQARSKTITVGEYARLREDKDFSDWRQFGGRSRMDMPVVLYLEQILFRAYRPPANINLGGGRVMPVESLDLVGRMVLAVTHDPVTGKMEYDANRNQEGTGYAIVKGLLGDATALLQLEPERVDVARYVEQMETWQPVGFQVDNSGEDGGYVLFDVPALKQANLATTIDGVAVLRADATFTPAEVKASLTFEAERFMWTYGDGDIAHAENVNGLCREIVVNGNLSTEVRYGDGKTAGQKAVAIARSLWRQQWFYASGGYIRYLLPGDGAILLNSMYDRVTVKLGANGLTEEVDFTTERQTNAFVPEREMDRREREKSLLPGQAELEAQARKLRVQAAALRQSPGFRRELLKASQGAFGIPPTQMRVVQLKSVTPERTLPVGCPVWWSTTKGEEAGARTAVTAGKHVLFAGVTVRHNEKTGTRLKIQQTGTTLVRVTLLEGKVMPAQTPLVVVPGTDGVGEEVVASDAVDAFYGDSRSVVIGTLLEDLPAGVAGEVRLARVALAYPRRVSRFEAQVLLVGNYVLRVRAVYDGTEYLVLKPQGLFTPPSAGAYERVSGTERKVTYTGTFEQVEEVILPRYTEEFVGEETITVQRLEHVETISHVLPSVILNDEEPEVIEGLESQIPPKLADLNLSARNWRLKPGTE